MKEWVQALTSFDHGGNRVKGTRFEMEKKTAERLASRGLVRLLGNKDPRKPAGKKPSSSASQAGQASQQTTSSSSGNGGNKASTPAKKSTKSRWRKGKSS